YARGWLHGDKSVRLGVPAHHEWRSAGRCERKGRLLQLLRKVRQPNFARSNQNCRIRLSGIARYRPSACRQYVASKARRLILSLPSSSSAQLIKTELGFNFPGHPLVLVT